MGNHSSKKSRKMKEHLNIRQTQSAIDLNENEGGEISQRKYDEMEVFKLKRELLETPQIFVLNNMLMSIMFFENYEREKNRFMNSSRTSLNKELNPTLLRDEKTECIRPDVIFETVNKNVRFQRVHGPNKNKIEPLVPRRMFVINDNIEVLAAKHTNNQYTAIDKPNYQVEMEYSEHSGFVKLKCVSSQAIQIAKSEKEPVNNKEPQPGPSSQPDDSDIYEYSTITMLNTPKPLEIQNCERRDTLPKSCFSKRHIRKYEENSDGDDSDEEFDKPNESKQKIDLYEEVSYISSKGFMTYFQNAVFPNSLGRTLGFDLSEIKLAKVIPGKIFCNLQDTDSEFPSLPCQIIPAVAAQWPLDLTFEFHARSERPMMWDKFGEEYRWPTDQMIKNIGNLRCVLIPKGYNPKRGENGDSEIEWEIAFPTAERYLDTHMNRTQMRAFLFLLTLYKTYIEPGTTHHGLLADHIRTHIYWEYESNPRDWPEHRLGTKMILIIQKLIQRLSKGHLPDFFIKKKNIFENVPNPHLKHAQRIFHNVVESPAIYFLGALRNLSYTNPNFYPHFDFKGLYKILTAENSISLVNSALLDVHPPNMHPKNRRPVVQGDANYRKEVRWKIKKEQLNREKHLKKLEEEKQREVNLRTERRGSIDSVNYEWQCEKRFDMFKIRELLMFFIRHFVEISKKSRRSRSPRQTLFYLKQAYYLAKILEELGLAEDARDLYELITSEEDNSKKWSVSESFDLPPTTPKRNSAQFNWDMLTQQVKNNNINLNNLTKSFNSTSGGTQSYIKKHPSNLKTRPTSLRNGFINDDRRKSAESTKVVEFSDAIQIR